jgi:hypothetical protein
MKEYIYGCAFSKGGHRIYVASAYAKISGSAGNADVGLAVDDFYANRDRDARVLAFFDRLLDSRQTGIRQVFLVQDVFPLHK